MRKFSSVTFSFDKSRHNSHKTAQLSEVLSSRGSTAAWDTEANVLWLCAVSQVVKHQEPRTSTLAEPLKWKFVFQHFNCGTWCCRPSVSSSSPQSRLCSSSGLCSVHQGAIKLKHHKTDELCWNNWENTQNWKPKVISHLHKDLSVFVFLFFLPLCGSDFIALSVILPVNLHIGVFSTSPLRQRD